MVKVHPGSILGGHSDFKAECGGLRKPELTEKIECLRVRGRVTDEFGGEQSHCPLLEQ